MALFQEGSRERELVIRLLISIILFVRTIALELCPSHEDKAELEKSFPEMLNEAHINVNAHIGIKEETRK